MSDPEIRRLERALAADPSDAVALEALAAARTRAGRGWAGEPLPLDLRCSPRERGVYVWTRHGLGLEMVLVPRATFSDMPPSEARAFYVGRYPVTNREWRLPIPDGGRVLRVHHVSQADHPVVNVTHASAVAFVEWAGLRLPTAAEWERAALGDGRVGCSSCSSRGGHENWDPWDGHSWSACDPCGGIGGAPRKFPWGNDAPTPERCVAATEWPDCPACERPWGSGDGSLCGVCYGSADRRSTLPVRDAEDRPARPLGASPCGAMDMAGHVWQWVDAAPGEAPFRSCGGSYASDSLADLPARDEAAPTVGFRVALSAPEVAP